MPWIQLRPTFDWTLEGNRQDCLSALQQQFQLEAKTDLFLLHGEYGELHLPPDQHRLWSPHLSFVIMDHPSLSTAPQHANRCLLHGRFAPRVEVWTAVWIAYLVCLCVSFFGAIFGYVQWRLGVSVWGLWMTLAALLVWIGIYFVALVGQQWSIDQIVQLRERLEERLQQAGIARARLDG